MKRTDVLLLKPHVDKKHGSLTYYCANGNLNNLFGKQLGSMKSLKTVRTLITLIN